MTKKPKRDHNPAIKTKVALASVRGEKTLAELAQHFGVHPNQITQWRSQLPGGAMASRGAWRDNVFVERLWKSVKYEEVYLRAYKTVSHARAPIGRYLKFTTNDARIRGWVGKHRTTPTSTGRFSQRPKPSMQSTYQADEPAQIKRAT